MQKIKQTDREIIVKAVGTIALEKTIVIEDLNEDSITFGKRQRLFTLRNFISPRTSIA